jgi:hypothetical protein
MLYLSGLQSVYVVTPLRWWSGHATRAVGSARLIDAPDRFKQNLPAIRSKAL